MKFDGFGLNERIVKAVADAGYVNATPIQKKAIPFVNEKRDLIGIAQTGTGKTAAFVLPILSALSEKTGTDQARVTRALILAPTRELVNQINQNIRTYAKYTNIRTVVVTGGVGEALQIQKLEEGVDIVVATPGRLQELMDRGFSRFDKIEVLVLDEADRMLDMGFLPSIEAIVQPLPNKRQTLLFSATLSKQIEKLAQTFLTKPTLVEVGDRSNPADTVDQYLYPVPKHLRAGLLMEMLEDHQFFAVIVFVRTRIEADVLTSELRGNKIDAEAIHGDKTQQSRVRALKWFKENKIRVLVATDVAARGLDIHGVTHVVNYDFPEQNDDYIHRIGRTGRAGSEGCAITFLTQYDDMKLAKLEKHIGRTLKRKELASFDYTVPAPEREKGGRAKKKVSRDGGRESRYSQSNKQKREPNQRGGRPNSGGSNRAKGKGNFSKKKPK